MFDFEKLKVYRKAQEFNCEVFGFLKTNLNIDSFLQNQLKRASVSISANIAEGSGRVSLADKRHFFVVSRSSAYEVFSLIETIKNLYPNMNRECPHLSQGVEELSRMLYGLIKNLSLSKVTYKSKFQL